MPSEEQTDAPTSCGARVTGLEPSTSARRSCTWASGVVVEQQIAVTTVRQGVEIAHRGDRSGSLRAVGIHHYQLLVATAHQHLAAGTGRHAGVVSSFGREFFGLRRISGGRCPDIGHPLGVDCRQHFAVARHIEVPAIVVQIVGKTAALAAGIGDLPNLRSVFLLDPYRNQESIAFRQPGGPTQKIIFGGECLHTAVRYPDDVEREGSLAPDPQERCGDVLPIGRPAGACHEKGLGLHIRQRAVITAVRRGDAELDNVLVGNAAQVRDLLSVGCKADGAVDIAKELTWSPTQHGNGIEVVIELCRFVGADVVDVIAIGGKRQTPEVGEVGRQNLDVALGGHLPNPQALIFSVAHGIGGIASIGRERGHCSFAVFRQLRDLHVLKIEAGMAVEHPVGHERDSGQ